MPACACRFAVRWGDKLKGGSVVDELMSHTDIAPTFLEAAGVPLPTQMAGRSLLPLLARRAVLARPGLLRDGASHHVPA